MVLEAEWIYIFRPCIDEENLRLHEVKNKNG